MSVPSPSDVPTPAGGSAPLSTSPAAARSSQPEFDIPYDFVSELPKSVGQQRWEAFVNKNKQNPFIGLGAFSVVVREGSWKERSRGSGGEEQEHDSKSRSRC